MITYRISYKVGEEIFTNDSPYLSVKTEEKENFFSLFLLPKTKVKILEARVFFPDTFHKEDLFFANGYQSWTDTAEQRRKSRTKKMGLLGRIPFLEKKYHFHPYGDYDFLEYHPHYSFSYTYLRNQERYRFFGSVSEKEGYTIFYTEKENKLCCYKDNKGMEIGETCLLFQIFQEEGTEKEVFDDYASSFHQKLKTVKPIKGFTTWYRHYQDIDEKKALIDLDAVSRSSIPFDVFQLDDGYETEIGDWVVPDKKKFPSGFAPLVRKIREADLIPGIWLAPFVASKNSQVFLSHPDWFLKDSQGQYLYHGGNWNGAYVLDFEKEEVREHIRFVLQALRKEGFSLFKLDFLYAVTLGENKTKSRGQRMCEAMEFLRKELSDSLILSCGVPLAPSFFLTDYCRIGPDVSLTYDDAFYMKLAHRERISTRITLKNTYYRRQLDRRFFLNDPDVFLQKGTKLKDKVKEEMFRVDSQYGSVFFTSDDLSLYSREETERFASLGKERSER